MSTDLGWEFFGSGKSHRRYSRRGHREISRGGWGGGVRFKGIKTLVFTNTTKLWLLLYLRGWLKYLSARATEIQSPAICRLHIANRLVSIRTWNYWVL